MATAIGSTTRNIEGQLRTPTDPLQTSTAERHVAIPRRRGNRMLAKISRDNPQDSNPQEAGNKPA
jgi:hypothetical protein